MTLEEFFKELEDKPIEEYIVTLAFKYDHEYAYTVENEILTVDMRLYPNHYVWLKDWNEGQTDIKVVGYIPVSEVNTKNGEK